MNFPRRLKRSSISFEKVPDDLIKITKLKQPPTPKSSSEDLKLEIKPKKQQLQQRRTRGRSYTVSSPVHNVLIYHQKMCDYHKALIQNIMVEQLVKSEQKIVEKEHKEINLDINTKHKNFKSKLVSLRTNLLKPLKIF